ncbi:glycosyltransferase [Cloacibacterium sp.]|uniref:glycosyltransferase n=1 Tax=Cloacibacterium sp. TaxID=1913682 RepID=UPI0035B41DD5
MNSNTRFKVLFISSWFPNKLEPTNGNFVQRHAEAVSLLHDVEILHAIGDSTQNEKFIFDDKVINGIRTLIVYYKNSKNPLLNFYRRMKAYQLGFKRVEKPDLVHGNVLHNNMLFAVYLKKKYKIPFVITEHWSAFLSVNQNKLSKAKKFIAQKIAEKAELIIPVSENLGNGLKNLEIKKPIEVIGNVIDTDLFSMNNGQKNEFIFLHISNLIPLKNPDKIIQAAVKLYNENFKFSLEIGGDGDVDMLNSLIREYNAESYIKTFGMISSQEVANKMKNANCFVLFSDYENQPCVILESFATGIPVIAPRVGGIPEIVEENRGTLVEKADEKALFEAMKNVLEDKIAFENSEVIRSYVVDNFSKQKIAEQFSEIYNKVLTK